DSGDEPIQTRCGVVMRGHAPMVAPATDTRNSSATGEDGVEVHVARLEPFDPRVPLEPRHLPARVPPGERLRLGDGLLLGHLAAQLPERLRIADRARSGDP